MNIKKYSIAFIIISVVSVLLPKLSFAQSSSFTFGAAGDFANGTNFQATVNAVDQENPAFMLALGDLSYSSTGEQTWCGKWKAVYNNIILETGNHDSGESSGGNINEYIQYCPFPLSGLNGTYGHQYYFDYPSVNPTARMIMIRPGVSGSGAISYSAGSAGYNFVSSAIDSARASGIKWIIVGMHKNYISMLEKPNELGSDLIPMLINKKVDLILQGHEHGYERSKQLAQNAITCPKVPTGTFDADCVVDSDDTLTKGAGTVIHVLGTGGQGLRSLNTSDSERQYFVKADNTTYGFGKFTVTPTQLTYNFVRSAGGSLTDSFTITDNGTNPSPISTPQTTPTMGPSITPGPTNNPTPTAVLAGDANRDGKVDLTDFQQIQSAFTTGDLAGDFNNNGRVDIFDFNATFSKLYAQFSSSPTPLASATPVVTPGPIITPVPTVRPTATATPAPTIISGSGIGPISLSYRQGGIWLTPAEIQQIPMDNASWDSLVSYSGRSMNIIGEIDCTAGGHSCSSDTTTPAAMYARAIVGMRTNNQTKINELKSELDKVETAINNEINAGHLDEKWPERNLGFIAVAANIIDYRPDSLLRGLRRALITQDFQGNTIEGYALSELPNKPSYGRWSYITGMYLMEDWARVEAAVKAEAKALGERNWGGAVNPHKFTLTGLGNDDNWQTLQPGGKSDPLLVMPSGIFYQDHGVGGLYLADQYRAANGPQWPPSFTDYIFEGMSPNIAIAFAMDHLGYANVFKLGNYALLRSMIFAYSSHDGKSSWQASGNDIWEVAALMTWAKPAFGNSLPDSLKPEPGAPVPWPLPVSSSSVGTPGRGMGFMYATHYARLAR